MSFVPISVEEYVTLHAADNPDEDAADLRARFRSCVAAALAGARCRCGEPIWVIGSVFAGHVCFTCITGEAVPSRDYEIDEALLASEAGQGHRSRSRPATRSRKRHRRAFGRGG